ncbi:hypothetical protein FB567DRAFT_564111 [Paraphoma chrysanthemicola]|uniref:Uncharacterized protein n=1 Tax=Paraphoma chrysanthemicola TaxID=798071 RepID=A0A8K0VT92_9PLEO|nr:hypothetical protein FB567DRAFT_564111 [Paraphoma chrysanthemicola]
MSFLGAVTLLNSYMLLVRDDEIGRRILIKGDDGYGNLDANSLRFQFLVGFSGSERVVLFRSTCVGIRPPSDPESIQRVSCNDNFLLARK